MAETIAAIVAGTGKVVATVGATAAAVGSKVATALHIGGNTAAAAGTAGKVAAAASKSSTILKALRVGTSVVSGLSMFATSQAQAEALKADAMGEDMQARQEYIQAQEAANAIQRQFNQLVADQRAVAAANGIDVSSGSVVEARQDAQAEADRQLTITRDGADLNASLRRARAGRLRTQATGARELGALGAAVKLGGAYSDIKEIG